MKSKGLKILLADDERVCSQTLALILNQSGYIAKAVFSGEEAVAAAADFAPDVLITDIIMRELTGVQAAAEIRRTRPNLRVFLYSTFTPWPELLEPLEEQEFTILIQPFHPQELLQMLEEGPSKLPDVASPPGLPT